LLGAGYVIF